VVGTTQLTDFGRFLFKFAEIYGLMVLPQPNIWHYYGVAIFTSFVMWCQTISYDYRKAVYTVDYKWSSFISD